jgi:hypothetical protein
MDFLRQAVKSATLVIDTKPLRNLDFPMRTEANIAGNEWLRSTEGVPPKPRRGKARISPQAYEAAARYVYVIQRGTEEFCSGRAA